MAHGPPVGRPLLDFRPGATLGPMTLDAPAEHTTHELLELVAAVLARADRLAPREVPGAILELSVDMGPFDFGALYVPAAHGGLEYDRGRGFPDDLRLALMGGFGAMQRLEACRRSGDALTIDAEDGDLAELSASLGVDTALLIPLLDDAESSPVLLLASLIHNVGGVGPSLARSFKIACEFARKKEGELKRSMEASRRWDRLVDVITEALVFSKPNGDIVQVNPAATTLFGTENGDLVGKKVNALLPGIDYRSEEWVGFANIDAGREKVQVRTAVLPKDARGNDLFLHAVRLLAPEAPRESDAPLDAAGPLDSSTGLPDRESFLAELMREMGLARKYRGWCSVLVIDLDGLSRVRQERPDDAGAILKTVGQTLQERLRKSDRLGRLGGDGFGVLLSRGSREQALALGNSLLALIRERSGSVGTTLTASIGISYFPDDADEAQGLLETAFGAMLLAKRGGGDAALVWKSDMVSNRPKAVRRPSRETRRAGSKGSARSASTPRADLDKPRKAPPPPPPRPTPLPPPARPTPRPRSTAPKREVSSASRPAPANARRRPAPKPLVSSPPLPPLSQVSRPHKKIDIPVAPEESSRREAPPPPPPRPSRERSRPPSAALDVALNTDDIDETDDINNLVVAMPEDPSEEVHLNTDDIDRTDDLNDLFIAMPEDDDPDEELDLD